MWLRALLVFLTVVASLMHLTRSPEAGGLGLMAGSMSQMMGGDPQAASASHHRSTENVQGEVRGDPQAKMDCLPGHEHNAASTEPDLTTQAPNAPPAHSGHSSEAHCPFCFTAAFALEAVGFALPFDGLAAHRWAEPTWLSPALKVIRHAEARAPPHLPA